MSRYVIQFFKKTSKISKDKELVEIYEKLEDTDYSEKEALKDIVITAVQKHSMLFKHNENIILNSIFINADEKSREILKKYIREQIEKYLDSDISRMELVDSVFNKAKEHNVFLSKNHFLLYVKKIQERKIIDKIKKGSFVFLNREYKKNLASFVKNLVFPSYNVPFPPIMQVKILTRQKLLPKLMNKMYEKFPYKGKAKVFVSSYKYCSYTGRRAVYIFLREVEKFFTMKNDSFLKSLEKLVYKILLSEPVTIKEIENLFEIDRIMEKIKNEIFLNSEEYIFIKKHFISFFKKELVENIKNILIKKIKENPEIEYYSDLIIYEEVFDKVRSCVDINNLKREDLKELTVSLMDGSFNVFYNFNRNGIETLERYLKELKSSVKSNQLKEELDSFLNRVLQMKIKEPSKEDILEIKESYETLKEKLFLYEKSSKTVRIFSLLRDAYKKTFFKSTEKMKEIYKKYSIENIVIKTEEGDIKFNSDSRVFELFDKKGNVVLSIPVKNVMNRERTAFRQEIDLSYSLLENKKLKVLNFDEINKILQQQRLKQVFSFNKKNNDLIGKEIR